VAEELRVSLHRQYPSAHIVGTYTPPFRPLNHTEASELQRTIDRLRPDIMWVGLSTPKQERFMAEYLPHLNATLMIGVGAAFDFHTGRLRDSPRWVKQLGLQWLHRLLQEPRRLWKRYLLNNPAFLASAFLQLANIRRFDLDDEERTPEAKMFLPNKSKVTARPR
jgi:N-acetylglucosaminyldiphosphoundecaprenol N-acetyl-beta-D-mannosaminyltransferase